MKKHILIFLALVAAMSMGIVAHAGTEKKVINIEAAMRAWQERQQQISSFTSWWQPRKDQIEPGDYPADGFYGEDLLDPDFCAMLVDNLFWEVTNGYNFIKPETAGNLQTEDIPFWDVFSDFDDVTRDNYPDVFDKLVKLINSMQTVKLNQDSFVGSSLENPPQVLFGKYQPDYVNNLNPEDAAAAAYQRWGANLDYWKLDEVWAAINPGSPYLRQWRQSVPHNGGHVYPSAIYTARGRFVYNLSRFTGTAKFYVGKRRTLTALSTFVDPFQGYTLNLATTLENLWLEPYSLKATIPGGTVWLSDYMGAAADEVEDFDFYGNPTMIKMLTWNPRMVVDLDLGSYISDPYTTLRTCSTCKDGHCEPGTMEADNGCVDVSISLGNGPYGSIGRLQIFEEMPTDRLIKPSGLRMQINRGARAVVNIVNDVVIPRQIDAPQAFVDIVELGASGYEIRFYAPTAKGSRDAAGVYAVGGTPFRVVRVDDPGNSSSRCRVQVFEGDDLTDSVDFAWSSADNGWALAQEKRGSVRNEVRTSSAGSQPGQRVEIFTIRDPQGNVTSKRELVYQVFPWNEAPNAINTEELVEETIDPDGVALRTQYGYYTDSNDEENYSRLKHRIDPSGYWEIYEYQSGAVSRKTSPYGSAPFGATENVRIVTIEHEEYSGETEIEVIDPSGGIAQEVSRTYRVFDYNQVRTIRCLTPGASDSASDNLVSSSTVYDMGSAAGEFGGRPYRELRPDGTGVLYRYKRVGENVETTVYEGVFSPAFAGVYAPYFNGNTSGDSSALTKGTKTVRVTDKLNELISESIWDIESGHLLSAMVATGFDSFGRVTRNDYNDGTFTRRAFGCCGIEYAIDRSGMRTDFEYDGFGRVTRETRAGVALKHDYDALGRRISTTRVGTDLSEMPLSATSYDSAGRVQSTTEFGTRVTQFDEEFGSGGETIRTTTFADGGTSVETTAMDGSLQSVAGTAVAPRNYEYGLDADGQFTKLIKVGANGAATEWVKTYVDLLGRTKMIKFPDDATAVSEYNAIGQLVRSVDPDGVATLFAYNEQGEQEVVAIDLNNNGAIDASGTDRISKTTSEIVSKTDGTTHIVRRITTEIWETDDDGEPTTISVAEQSMDGLHSWLTAANLTTRTTTVYDGSGGRTITTTTPDGVQTVQIFTGNLLTSSTVRDANGLQTAATTYAYDEHNRLRTSTDARNGATTLSYHSNDLIESVATPDPDPARSGAGYDFQTTTYDYDSMGRVQLVTQPDGGLVHTTYWPTGAVRRTWGSRTYPTEYTYDPQGRVKTLTTWQNFAGNTGQAVTTWNYTPDRGFLENKRYADGQGPDYTYTFAGRLLTRTWARGIVCTYGYNAAGDLTSVDYSDGTPDVVMGYDRTGRPDTITDASGTRTLTYDALGQLKDEDYTAGLLASFGVRRDFDSLSRLTGLSVVRSPSSVLSAVGYAYDAASRLKTVTAGSNTATYGYVPDSALVQTVTFAQGETARLTTTKSYDNLNRLSAISHLPNPSSQTPVPISYAYAYNSANQRTKATRENNAYWNYDYDLLGQVTDGKKFDAANATLSGYDFAWTYDDIGNRKTSTTNNQLSTYTPNDLNEYTQRTVSGVIDVRGAAAATATVTVSLNNGSPQTTTRNGELFFKQIAVDNTSGAQNPSVKITGVKNLVGAGGEDAVTEIPKTAFLPQTPESFVHDADGNLTDDARWHYTWDGENRLVAMESNVTAVAAGVDKQRLEFSYDSQSRRIAKNVFDWDGTAWVLGTSTRFIYDGWNLIAELRMNPSTSTFDLNSSYAWGLDLSGSMQGAGGVGGLLFAQSLGSGPSSFSPCYDGNGNVIAYVDLATGAKSATYEYGVFGETLIADGVAAEAIPFRFSTKFTDIETGLLYYGYRYYSSQSGRWLTRDPLGESGGVGLYTFVRNSPFGLIDAFGLTPFETYAKINLAIDQAKSACSCYKSIVARLNQLQIDFAERFLSTNDDLTRAVEDVRESFNELRENYNAPFEKADEIAKINRLVARMNGFEKVAVDGMDGFRRLPDKLDLERHVRDLKETLEYKHATKVLNKVSSLLELSSSLSRRDAVDLTLTAFSLLPSKAIAFGPGYFREAYRGVTSQLKDVAPDLLDRRLNELSVACFDGGGLGFQAAEDAMRRAENDEFKKLIGF